MHLPCLIVWRAIHSLKHRSKWQSLSGIEEKGIRKKIEKINERRSCFLSCLPPLGLVLTHGRCATMEKQNKGPDPFLCHPALVGPNHCQQTLLSSTKKTQQGSGSAMTTLACVAKSVKQYQCPCYSSQGVRIRTCAKGTNSPSAAPSRDDGETRGRCATMEKRKRKIL